MRGGTSKGIFIELSEVPSNKRARISLLTKLLGEDQYQMDGLGGGDSLNSKVAIVSKSKTKNIDIDYHFVQIIPGRGFDDTIPCGNMLSGVGAFACEFGLINSSSPTTKILIRDVNTGSVIEQVLQTPNKKVKYAGNVLIPGTHNHSSPVTLSYRGISGCKTGKLWPTGAKLEIIDNTPISLVDATIPVMIVPAQSVGLNLNGTIRSLHQREIISKLLHMRQKVAKTINIDPHNSAVPKVAVVGVGKDKADISAFYFTPYTPHKSLAVTGAISIATALVTPGTVANLFAKKDYKFTNKEIPIKISHIAGEMQLYMQFQHKNNEVEPVSAKLIRTTRLLMKGTAYLPS